MNNAHIVRKINKRREAKKRTYDTLIPLVIALCLIAIYGLLNSGAA